MSLKRNLVYTFLSQGPRLIVGILAGIFITRMLGPEGKGAYAIFMANILLFSLVLGLGLNSSLVYFSAKKSVPLGRLVSIILIVLLLGSFILTIFFFLDPFPSLVGVFLPEGFDDTTFRLYLVTGFAVELVTGSLVGILSGLKYFEVISKVSVIQSIILFLIVLLYFIFQDYTDVKIVLKHVLYIYLSVNTITLFFYIFFLYRKERVLLDTTFNFAEFKIILTFSGIAYASEIINFLNYRLDLWVVDIYKSTYELGLYSLAVNLAQMLWMISVPVSGVLMTYITSNSDKEYRIKILKTFARLTSTVVITVSLLMLFVAPFIIPLIYGKDFQGSILPFWILLPGLAVSTIFKIFVPINIAHGKVKYNLVAVSVSLIFTLALDFLLIPIFGIVGAAIATTVSYFISCLIGVFFIFYKLKYPITNYYFLTLSDFKYIKENLLK